LRYPINDPSAGVVLMSDKLTKITIPVIVSSVNETNKLHWGARDRLKKQYRAHIEGAIHDMGMTINKLKRPKKRRVLIYSFRKREMDRDNIWASHKQLLDAIKDLGLIWDDSEKYIDLTILQLKHPEIKTEIFIIDDK